MLTVRKAIPEDAPYITEFQLKMARETEKLKLDPEIIANGVNAVFKTQAKGQYYVAEYEAKVIASLLITHEWSDWRNAEIWWLQSVYVLPGFRRKGIFRSMYSFIKNEAENAGAAGLRLYVVSNNLTACKTYEALGMNGEHYKMYEWIKDK